MESAWIEELLRRCRERDAAPLVKQDSGRQLGQQGRDPGNSVDPGVPAM